MIPPPPVTYLLDLDSWGTPFSVQNEEHHTHTQTNNWITLMLVRYEQKGYQGYDLWEEFQEGFEGWTTALFTLASREVIKELRTWLSTHGVWVRRQAGSITYVQTLTELLEEENPHEYTEEERRELKQLQESNRQGRDRSAVSEPIVRQPESSQTPQPPENHSSVRQTTEAEGTQVSDPAVRSRNVRNEIQQGTEDRLRVPSERQWRYPPYQQFSPTPHPRLVRDDEDRAPRRDQSVERRLDEQPRRGGSYDPEPGQAPTSNRPLTDLMKIYSRDEQKYGGLEYDIIDVKL